MRARALSGTPGPWSRTAIRAADRSLAQPTSTSMGVPGRPYFTALERRLTTTCSRRLASTTAVTGCAARTTMTRSGLAACRVIAASLTGASGKWGILMCRPRPIVDHAGVHHTDGTRAGGGYGPAGAALDGRG